MDRLPTKKERNTKLLLKIAGIVVVSIAIIWATDIINRNLGTKKAGKQETIDITSYSGNIEGINAVNKIVDKSGNTTGYMVDVTVKGYGGDIQLEAEFNAAGDQILGYTILEQSETEGLGSKIAEEDFAGQFKELGLPVSLNGFPEKTQEENTEAQTAEQTPTELRDGAYRAEEKDFDEKGYKGIVTMEVKDGAITALTWDAIDQEGNMKSQLALDGKYVMTEDGPRWDEQAEALAKYVIDNQSLDGLNIDDAGKTDTIASVSINISGFVNLVKECMNQAAGTGNQALTLQDGSFLVEEKDFDEKGYKGIVTMEVKGGAITALTWDCIDQEGNMKSQLALDGKYVMTEDGLRWDEQAEALAKYVIDNQSLDGLNVDEAGKTDTIASVSINISGFVNLVKDCMYRSSRTINPEKVIVFHQDGSFKAEEQDFDEKGYKGIVTMEVNDGAITALTWDSIDQEGNMKSQLALDGKYVMTEDGPRWDEQAEALAKYVIDNQSLDGLNVDEAGKTDTIASVSISISGFVNLVKDCMNQADAIPFLDGSYKVEEKDFDEKGYKGIVTMEVKDGAITALTWDCIDQEGNMKSQLALDGEYVMTEDGPRWDEQAEALAKYVIDNQSLDGLNVDEAGKTDTIASVSINISGFVNLVKESMQQASVGAAVTVETIPEKVEEPAIASENGVDSITGATASSRAVVRAANNAYLFLKEFVIK